MSGTATIDAPWWKSFCDNLSALIALKPTIDASSDASLKSEYLWLVNEGNSLKDYLTGLIASGPHHVQTGVAGVSSRVTDWLNNAYTYSKSLASANLNDGFQADPRGSFAFKEWMRTLLDDPLTAIDQLTATMQKTGSKVAGAANAAGNLYTTLANLPWMWIGLGLGALYFVSGMGEDDGDEET